MEQVQSTVLSAGHAPLHIPRHKFSKHAYEYKICKLHAIEMNEWMNELSVNKRNFYKILNINFLDINDDINM